MRRRLVTWRKSRLSNQQLTTNRPTTNQPTTGLPSPSNGPTWLLNPNPKLTQTYLFPLFLYPFFPSSAHHQPYLNHATTMADNQYRDNPLRHRDSRESILSTIHRRSRRSSILSHASETNQDPVLTYNDLPDDTYSAEDADNTVTQIPSTSGNTRDKDHSPKAEDNFGTMTTGPILYSTIPEEKQVPISIMVENFFRKHNRAKNEFRSYFPKGPRRYTR